jgi:uncharacterized RDD family membrane protein YckC
MVDIILLTAYLIITKFIIFSNFEFSEGVSWAVLLAIGIPAIFYSVAMELFFGGQTAGKALLNIRVMSLEGGEPSMGQFLLRWLLRFYEWGFVIFYMFWHTAILGFFILLFGGLISVIIMMATKKNQRLGDLIAGTVVVNTQINFSVDDTIFKAVSSTDHQVKFPEVMRLTDRDINTIKTVLKQAQKSGKYDMLNRVATKVQDVLNVPSDLYAEEFLERVLEDYNYLSIANAADTK